MTTPSDPSVILAGLQAAAIDIADSAGCAGLLGEVKRVRGWLDAYEARISRRLRELHDQHGAAPVADEHARCGGVSAEEGRRKERRAKTLDDVPAFDAALAEGEITAEHADALAAATATLKPELKAELLEREADLLADAKAMRPDRFGREVRELIRRLERDHGVERNRHQREHTFLARKLNPQTGMTEGRFALHPELAQQIFGAIDTEVAALIARAERVGDPDGQGRTVDRNRLAAEAWGTLVGGGHQARRPAEADITLIVDWQTATTGRLHAGSVCETGDGTPIPPPSVARWLCQGRITPIIITTNGDRIDAGRTIRTANRTQRRALRARYRTCGFGDCDVPFDRCEIHHIIAWEHGGPTDLANLIPLCSRHHHVTHADGWTLDLAPDRTLTIRHPNGTIYLVCEPDMAPAPPRSDRRRQPAA